MSSHQVVLTVPALSEYALTVRMTAAALVAHKDLSYEKVDEVRLAAEEAFIFAVDTLAEDATVTFVFTLLADVLRMEVSLGGETDVSAETVERASGLASMVLEAVCDSFDLAQDASGSKLCLEIGTRADSADVV